MCGIAGVVGPRGSNHGQSVRDMCDAMVHRGPDDDGFFDEDGAHLGMRRLAIIDVAHGAQPMSGEDGSVVTVFNGEIYNYRELQALLRARGHQLSTDSDTECLTHLYEDAGPEFVDDLRGMFGLAVWDRANRVLILARDRAGKKPLYYYQDGPRLWFASELKCLLTNRSIPREVDPDAVHHYLTYQYVPNPWSILKGIKKLPPAHRLVWRDGQVSVERYWQLTYAASGAAQNVPEADLAEQLRAQILEATRIRMISERPLGAFLSGGLDSSAVVAAMSQISSSPVKTFSIGFEEEKYNELPFAREVAKLYGTEHCELVVKPDVEDLLPRLAKSFDEPFADSSAVPSYYVAEMARKHVVVALNGDGGDEGFGGYPRYASFLQAPKTAQLPAPIARLAERSGSFLYRHPAGSRTLSRIGSRVTRIAATDPAIKYGRMMSYLFPEEKTALYRESFRAQITDLDSFALGAKVWRDSSYTDPVNRLLAMDMTLYLPGDLLPKVDITTMMVSLEARSPLLDHQLLEWAAKLPGDLKVRGGVTKYLMKRAMEPWLPDSLIHRTKMGFGIPRDEWLQGPLKPMVHDLLLTPQTRIRAYFKDDGIRQLVSEHEALGTKGPKVWALLMLELWQREVLES